MCTRGGHTACSGSVHIDEKRSGWFVDIENAKPDNRQSAYGVASFQGVVLYYEAGLFQEA